MVKVLYFIFGILVVLLICPIGIILEKKGFNFGYCPICHTKLRHFANDSQGGRGYICDECNYHTWVTYNCVDKQRNTRTPKERGGEK
ncbi:MAG: hypothetical protein E7391_04160 [Ruminococcaceae bacterium]|nr:hypothetical protein [Oscillospiraceae bacterium]